MAGSEVSYEHGGGSNLFGAFATGKITADDTTPTDMIVQCGFQPSAIVLINLTDDERYEWYAGMDETVVNDVVTARGMLNVAAGASTANVYTTTGGPLPYSGDAGVVGVGVNQQDVQDGFIILAAMQAVDEVILWVAYR